MLRSKFLKALKWKTKNKRSYEKSEPKTQIPQAQNRRWNFNSRPVTRKPKGPKPENSRYYYSWWFVSAGSTKLNVPRELNFFFFWIWENLIFQKTYFIHLDEGVKLYLSQTFTRNARPDSNSRPAMQISNLLSLHYAF
jgi:hypothetical protein